MASWRKTERIRVLCENDTICVEFAANSIAGIVLQKRQGKVQELFIIRLLKLLSVFRTKLTLIVSVTVDSLLMRQSLNQASIQISFSVIHIVELTIQLRVVIVQNALWSLRTSLSLTTVASYSSHSDYSFLDKIHRNNTYPRGSTAIELGAIREFVVRDNHYTMELM